MNVAAAYVTRAEVDPRRRAALMGAEHHYEAGKAPGSRYPPWADVEPTYRELSVGIMQSTLERLERAGLITMGERT